MLESSLGSSTGAGADQQDIVLRLLAPDDHVPRRYQQVSDQLREWGLPGDLVQLGLVMRRVEQGTITPVQLAPLLGDATAEVAGALAALGGPPRPALRAIELAWKLFTLAYLNPSAVVMKIAELLMQLRHSQDADITIGDETLGAAAGICARLGMWDVRAELLDAQARLADPHLVQRARALLDTSSSARKRFFESFRCQLAELLRGQALVARIERRERPVSYLIEHGLASTHGSLPWSDVVVVLIEETQECYRALGAINSAYPVIGSKIRDYIGGPRENGYQAIHTTVEHTATLEDDRTASVDIRISTAAMYRYNRRGYLAELAGAMPPARRKLWWHDRQRWLDAYRGQSEELFVYTPRGEAIFLPRGATVLDFAVRVHLDLGVYCRGGLVNGTRVSPGERLECGDICEVLIERDGAPIDRRLLDLAGTAHAKNRIRRALQKDRSGVARGRHTFHEVLTRRLEEQEVHASTTLIDQQVAAICRVRGYHSIDAFYRAVARGEAAPDQVIRAIIDGLLIPRLILDALPAGVRARAEHIRLALCCRPRPSQPAVATAIHTGHQLKIHAAGCSNVVEPAWPVAWRPAEQQAFAAEVLYEGWDRPGLIHQLAGAVSTVGGINIRSFNADVPEPSLARIRFTFEAPNREQLDQVQHVLESLPERRHVELRTVTLVDEGFRITTPLINPYGPHPVGRRPFFVGRSAEVRRILAHLDGQGARHLLIRGPKRIGKSSLLEHLARYHLDQFKVIARVDLQSLPTDELRLERLLKRIADLLTQRAGARGRAVAIDTTALASDPARAFGSFLGDLHDPRDPERFVVLIDELGVVASRLRSIDTGRGAEHEFFDQWRALLNDERVYSRLAFIAALPDYSLERMLAGSTPGENERPTLRIGELGTPIRLGVLDEADARDLIAAPVGSHLEYAPADLDLLLAETGGHPYYIHLVCSQVVTAIQVQQRKTGRRFHERQTIPHETTREALQTVLAHEDAFHHVIADSTPGTGGVLRAIAMLGSEGQWIADRAQMRQWIARKYANIGPHAITWALEERPDLLFQTGDQVGIRVALVARWLRSHA